MADIEISIDNKTMRIDYCRIEQRVLDPRLHFNFSKGQWETKLENFPIDGDHDLDILVIVIGNPRTKSNMKVKIDGIEKGTFKTYKAFNRNGYAQFNEEIPV